MLSKKSNSLNVFALKQSIISTFMVTLTLSGLLLVQGCKKEMRPSELQDEQEKASHLNMTQNLKTLSLQLIADNFVSPITLVQPPDGSHRLFVVDQIGIIWIIDGSGNKLPQPFIDVRGKMVTLMPFYDERGLLGLAFHPDFKNNGKFYLFYTAPPPAGGPTVQTGNTGLPMTWDNTTTISEFRVSASNRNMADIGSERIILQEPHPQFNHNGGTIAFGSDGYLYISIGDGGNKNDIGPGHVEDWYPVNAGGNGQDIEANLMGNILRIDVNSTSDGKNYAIPSDNPFVGKRGLDEIYAYGFRNPYRFSFDMSGSRRLFVGDAGQNLYEEVDVVTKGGNYGWNVKEGTECFNAANELQELSTCPSVDAFGNPLIDPVIQANNHENPEGGNFVVIVGGYVYRGNNIPGLQGKYIFGNFSREEDAPEGEIYVSNPGGSGLWSYAKLPIEGFQGSLENFLKGFGQDLDGEVYVLVSKKLGPSGNTGKVYKLVLAGKNK
ncbi:MAG: PQQ-dependent sugar dehydrogenase [Chitinophagaceae bacterium]|nr:PQQ-dependent sugar dehydrogenase [Chitinophagaceae bacterium]